MIDLHAHILPGLDDGARNVEGALEMARNAERDGIEKIVATPHLYRHPFPLKDFSLVEEKWKELVSAFGNNQIKVELLLGAEVHFIHDLISEVKRNRRYLVLNQSTYLLLEFPAHHVFPGVKEFIFILMSEGITPIIAHPERNLVFMRNPELIFELVHQGVLVQANSGSFSRFYGQTVQEAAYNFLKLNLIHFIASDCHHQHDQATRFVEARKRITEAAGEEKAEFLFKLNPQAVINNREIPYFPEPLNPRNAEKSLKVKIPSIFWWKR